MPRSRLSHLLHIAMRDSHRRTHAWTRRRFMQTAAAGAAGAYAVSLPALADSRAAPSVAIIGAGLAGLTAAYHLRAGGIVAQVYEASGRVGGRVWSRTDAIADGMVVELGGEFINSNHADMLALAAQFDLALFNRADDAARFQIPETGYFLANRNLGEAELAPILQPLAAQIAADADLLEQDFSRYSARFDRLSVAQYLEQHARLIPADFVRTLIAASIRTEYGVEPAQSSALQLLFNLTSVNGDDVIMLGNSDEVFTVEGGNSRIIDALALTLAGNIHTRMPLTRLEGGGARGFRLTFANGQTAQADYVILAVPPRPLRAIDIDASLPALLRRAIAEIDLGVNEKLIAGFTHRAWRQPTGFVGEAWTDLGFSETWDASQRQTQRADGALTFLMGGDEVRRDERSIATQAREFIDRLATHIPEVRSAATGEFLRTRWTQNRWIQGAYTNFKPGQLTRFSACRWVEAEAPAESQTVRSGRLFFIGEQFSDEFYGFMNGAAQTGRLAAQALQALVRTRTHAVV